MASHRLKRALKGAMGVTAVVAVVSFSPSPAMAQPPTTASEAVEQYKKLSEQAATVNEDLLKAQDDLKARKADYDKATKDVAAAKELEKKARAQEEAFRGQVDDLASASFQGARFNKISALLTGDSPDDFLERASALSVLAADSEQALSAYTSAVTTAEEARRQAEDGQKRAAKAKADAEKLTADITKKRDELQKQIEEVDAARQRLTAEENAELRGPADTGVYIAPPGAAGIAMNTALAQRGDMYEWGAEGPNTFDCSGLMVYAYREAGVSLPRSSRAQFGVGVPVSRSELKAGDLVFYGSSAGSIHHVAMYIGGGRIVHASTFGVPVKTDTIDGGGSDYFGARRVAG
ncbi:MULTISPECIES: C40 family peptidase [Actinokineospora]|uniref:Hydrolase Nlp/P60 n=1 Tax=Actinokineospora fastidiosa TaxID=1816 RepID=A0A918GK49_9PSEU|nr:MULTISPECIES: C40 family peptidase [Actinokineospora]UVS77858.1 putative endopeptidase p60 precursor [Actinokineospora sp. UTMC 2448]GGS40509.1 hydrolase Nlp/P60 [Actinokineospora fastidiosa]